MAYVTGTATNCVDLINKLEDFLTTNPTLVAANQQWVCFKDNEVMPYSRTMSLDTSGNGMYRFFKGPGNAGTDEVYVNLLLAYNKGSDWYQIWAMGASRYSPKNTIQGQFNAPVWGGAYNQWSYMPVWEKAMQYWFIANGRRFIVVVKVSNNYEVFYGGLFTPTGTDLEYPYPLFIGGSDRLPSRKWSTQGTDSRRGFWNSQGNSDNAGMTIGKFLTPQGTWMYAANNTSINTGVPNAYIQPYHGNIYVGKTFDGLYMLEDITIESAFVAWNTYGTFDGVYRITGYQNSSGNTAVINGDTYLCIAAAGNEGVNDYAAILLK